MDMTEVVSTENEVILEDNKNAFEGSAKTARTLKNIKSLVAKTLKEDYGIEDENKVEALLKTHGLSASQFDFVSAAENALNTQVLNDVSVDANANKCEKTIESMMTEASNPIKKAIGYDMLYRQLKQDYGKAEAKRLTAEMYTYALALADSTKILSCYCYSIDASAIVKRGRDFGQLHSAPSKRLCSYISCLCETIHQMSNHLAGAIAVGTFFMDAAHVLMYTDNNGFGYTIEQIRIDKDIRKMIENEFQQFVHSVNHLSRNASESPFSNVSVFDMHKLLTLLGDADMKEYFKDETEDFKSNVKDESWIDYVADYIMELQKIFIDFFDKGDKLSNGMPYRFPVVTVNLSKSEDGDTPILDEEFFDYLTHKDIYRYNIFSSCGTKLASCCRLINDLDLMTEYGSQSNSFGGTGISLGSHRVVTIDFNRIALESDSYKQYFSILDRRIEDSAKILSSHKRLLQLLTDKGLQLFIQNGWIRMDRLFSTFGVLGLTETASTVKTKNWEDMPDGTDIIKDSLIYLNRKMFDVSSEYGIMGNIEQIPAESMAVRLAKTDRLLFGEDKVPYKLYANQFVPLWEEASIWEKLSTDGKYNKLITGGGIVHAQIGEKVTPNQAKKIIKYAIDCGCEHFALNAVYTKCNNGHSSFGNKTVCPVCGSQELHHFTRVVGFFTEVENWNPVRRDWEFPRRTFVTLPSDTDKMDDVPLSQKPTKSETPRAATSTELLTLNKNDDNPKYYFFYRSSCPHCHDMAHFLTDEAYSKIPGKAIRVDNTDTENIKLAKAFDVEETPTLVITDEHGNAKIDSKLNDKGLGIPFAFKALLSGKDSEYINELISLTSDEGFNSAESSDCVDCHF